MCFNTNVPNIDDSGYRLYFYRTDIIHETNSVSRLLNILHEKDLRFITTIVLTKLYVKHGFFFWHVDYTFINHFNKRGGFDS